MFPHHHNFFLCPPWGWFLWTEGEAGHAGLPAFGSMLRDHRFACWSDLHRLGHPVVYPAARQHVLQLVRGACVWERVRIGQIRHWNHTSVGVFGFRASRLRWLVSSVRRRPGGLDACCRFLPRPCRPSSLTESQSVASHAPASYPPYFCPCANWLALLSTGDDLRQDLLPSVCGKCHWIQVRKSPQEQSGRRKVSQTKINLTLDEMFPAWFQWQQAKNGSPRMVADMSFHRIQPNHMPKPLELVLFTPNEQWVGQTNLRRKLTLVTCTLSAISFFFNLKFIIRWGVERRSTVQCLHYCLSPTSLSHILSYPHSLTRPQGIWTLSLCATTHPQPEWSNPTFSSRGPWPQTWRYRPSCHHFIVSPRLSHRDLNLKGHSSQSQCRLPISLQV